MTILGQYVQELDVVITQFTTNLKTIRKEYSSIFKGQKAKQIEYYTTRALLACISPVEVALESDPEVELDYFKENILKDLKSQFSKLMDLEEWGVNIDPRIEQSLDDLIINIDGINQKYQEIHNKTTCASGSKAIAFDAVATLSFVALDRINNPDFDGDNKRVKSVVYNSGKNLSKLIASAAVVQHFFAPAAKASVAGVSAASSYIANRDLAGGAGAGFGKFSTQFCKLSRQGNVRSDFINWYKECLDNTPDHDKDNIPKMAKSLEISAASYPSIALFTKLEKNIFGTNNIKEKILELGKESKNIADESVVGMPAMSFVDSHLCAISNMLIRVAIGTIICNIIRETSNPGSKEMSDFSLPSIESLERSVTQFYKEVQSGQEFLDIVQPRELTWKE
ncbi:hypothetical protein N9X24_02005, partial [Rickettsiales bacterium]|nr:hypothetical protein [Rickettsiales bacterium]